MSKPWGVIEKPHVSRRLPISAIGNRFAENTRVFNDEAVVK